VGVNRLEHTSKIQWGKFMVWTINVPPNLMCWRFGPQCSRVQKWGLGSDWIMGALTSCTDFNPLVGSWFPRLFARVTDVWRQDLLGGRKLLGAYLAPGPTIHLSFLSSHRRRAALLQHVLPSWCSVPLQIQKLRSKVTLDWSLWSMSQNKSFLC
jgi:hypothetical protein